MIRIKLMITQDEFPIDPLTTSPNLFTRNAWETGRGICVLTLGLKGFILPWSWGFSTDAR